MHTFVQEDIISVTNGRLEHTDLSPEAGTTETQNLGTVHTGTLTLELELELLLDAIPEA